MHFRYPSLEHALHREAFFADYWMALGIYLANIFHLVYSRSLFSVLCHRWGYSIHKIVLL